jgi:hypothetical protein
LRVSVFNFAHLFELIFDMEQGIGALQPPSFHDAPDGFRSDRFGNSRKGRVSDVYRQEKCEST